MQVLPHCGVMFVRVRSLGEALLMAQRMAARAAIRRELVMAAMHSQASGQITWVFQQTSVS